jgi:hypothetical protein
MFYELMRRRGRSASMRSICSGWTAGTCGIDRCSSESRFSGSCFRAHRDGSVREPLHEPHGPVPRNLRLGHGGSCREAGERQVYAGRDGRSDEKNFFDCRKAENKLVPHSSCNPEAQT